MTTARERGLNPVEPFSGIRFSRKDGGVTVVALGRSLLLPGISITRHSLTMSGRGKTDCVDFEPEELPELIQYLQDALKHWKEG